MEETESKLSPEHYAKYLLFFSSSTVHINHSVLGLYVVCI